MCADFIEEHFITKWGELEEKYLSEMKKTFMTLEFKRIYVTQKNDVLNPGKKFTYLKYKKGVEPLIRLEDFNQESFQDLNFIDEVRYAISPRHRRGYSCCIIGWVKKDYDKFEFELSEQKTLKALSTVWGGKRIEGKAKSNSSCYLQNGFRMRAFCRKHPEFLREITKEFT